MPRNINSTVLQQLTGPSLRPAVFVSITFKSETVYVWSGIGTVNWNGHYWTGIGTLLSISSLEDGNTVDARGASVTFSGLDSTMLGQCMTEFVLGKPAAIYLGVYSGGNLIPFPITAWAGRTDQPTVNVSGTEVTITINLENRLVDMNIPGSRRYENSDQQMAAPSGWPGDQCFAYTSSLLFRNLFWGSTPQTQNVL
jgi:hypothetical protein